MIKGYEDIKLNEIDDNKREFILSKYKEGRRIKGISKIYEATYNVKKNMAQATVEYVILEAHRGRKTLCQEQRN